MNKNFVTFTALAVSSLFLCHCGKHQEAEATIAPPKLKEGLLQFPKDDPRLSSFATAPVSARPAVRVKWFGRLEWDDDHTVRVFSPVRGRVVEVLVKNNDVVKEGDALATISSAEYAQAVADVTKAEADLSLSQKNLKRAQDLLKIGAIATKDLEAAETDEKEKVAELKRAKKAITSLDNRAGDNTDLFAIRAPTSGRIVDLVLNRGQQVSPDQVQSNFSRLTSPLFTISDPHHLRLILEVPEERLPECRVGSEVVVQTRSGDKTYQGRITGVDSDLDATTGHGRVRCIVSNDDLGTLRAGMVVKAEFSVSSHEASGVLVPSLAVVGAEGLRHVYLSEGSGNYRKVDVEPALGDAPDGLTAITGKITPGQTIVTTGSLLLDAAFQDAAEAK
jgi:cobalt-zinc-cadmium efflux system membrane fusion protein